MKKLLSLLSIVTISGATMPMVVAASPYQKQEKTIDNLENLIRNKKNINNQEIEYNVKKYLKLLMLHIVITLNLIKK